MSLLVLIGVPVVETLVFIEVGRATGWLVAVALLLGTSLLGTWLLRIRARWAMEGVSLALSEHRPPAPAAIDGALGLLGAALLVVPGFVTDLLGVLLLFRPTRMLARRRLSRSGAARLMSLAARRGPFPLRDRRPPDVESTAVDDDPNQLNR